MRCMDYFGATNEEENISTVLPSPSNVLSNYKNIKNAAVENIFNLSGMVSSHVILCLIMRLI